MTALLWRMEYHRSGSLGGAIPVVGVWEKVLEAPDNSDMVIRRNDQKIGFIRWLPNLSQPPTVPSNSGGQFQPEGMLAESSIYTIDVDGNFMLANNETRYRFALNIEFDSQKNWRRVFFRFIARPSTWELEADAEGGQVTVRYRLEEAHWSRTFSFDELRHPSDLIQDFGQGGFLVEFIKQMAGPLSETPSRPSMKWSAHHDRIRLGRSQMRAYRVEGELMNRFRVTAHVSRVGELLKVSLPGNMRLVNEAIAR